MSYHHDALPHYSFQNDEKLDSFCDEYGNINGKLTRDQEQPSFDYPYSQYLQRRQRPMHHQQSRALGGSPSRHYYYSLLSSPPTPERQEQQLFEGLAAYPPFGTGEKPYNGPEVTLNMKKPHIEISSKEYSLLELSAFVTLPRTSSRDDLLVQNQDDVWHPILEWLQRHELAELQQALLARDAALKTALHYICQHEDPDLDIFETLMFAYPDLVMWPDRFGWLPLHYACAYGKNQYVVQCLTEEYPKGKILKDNKGYTPLHLAIIGHEANSDSSRSFRNNSTLIATLASTGAASIPNNEGLMVRFNKLIKSSTEALVYCCSYFACFC